jgi:hypothetical protein
MKKISPGHYVLIPMLANYPEKINIVPALFQHATGITE